MPVIQAYQCPKTGKLFVDKQLYIMHLRSMAKANLRKKKEARIRRTIKRTLSEFRKKVSTLTELSRWIIEHSEVFYVNAKIHGHNWDERPGPKPGLGKIHSFEFLNISYSDHCSNTHCSPIGKPQNWRQEDHLPTSYPGWKGRYRVAWDDRPVFISQLFENTGINSGMGGGREFDITLFCADWPGLVTTAMLRKLSGGTSSDIT